MAKKHLTIDERRLIQDMLDEKSLLADIARYLKKHPSTISNEVKAHALVKRTGAGYRPYNACKNRAGCEKHHICNPCHAAKKYKRCKSCSMCNRFCPDFEKVDCRKLSKPPYVCNGCGDKHSCSLEKKFYNYKSAQAEYELLRSESRNGITIDESELAFLDGFLSPLIRQGQSIHHICINNRDTIMQSERTIYRLIEDGLLSAKNIDLPFKVRFKKRRKKRIFKVDKTCRVGRTYEDFRSFMEENPGLPVVQLDSVEGKKSGKVLLTIHFVNAEFMLAFIRNHNTSQSVIDIFNYLYDVLGRKLFMELFPVCLTDNGSEFSNPKALEFDSTGLRRTRVFYCDPQASYQKGSAERNHSLIRRFIPKGVDMSPYSQDDISLMMNHINSYSRKSLGDKTPYEIFGLFYGFMALSLLECKLIPAKDITLNKTIFAKEDAHEKR